jgi:hypothetical protein
VRFVSPELIESRLGDIRTEDLQGNQKLAVETFRKALKRKREGKSRTSILDDELSGAQP